MIYAKLIGIRLSIFAGIFLLIGLQPACAEYVRTLPKPSLQEFPYRDYMDNFPVSSLSQTSISDDGNIIAYTASYHHYGDFQTLDTGIFLYNKALDSTSYISLEGTIDYKEFADSWSPAVSGNGKYVAFVSTTTLFPDDNNNVSDIFVYSVDNDTLERVSFSSSGGEGCNSSDYSSGRIYTKDPSISYDGRFVAFTSSCSGFVANDTNHAPDVFVRDRLTGTTERITKKHDGTQTTALCFYPAISGDGQKIAFISKDKDLVEGYAEELNTPFEVNTIYLYNRENGTTSVATPLRYDNGGTSNKIDINYNGSVIAYSTLGDDQVETDNNGYGDVFVHDFSSNSNYLVSKTTEGFLGNNHSGLFDQVKISADGNYVAFSSYANNMVNDDYNDFTDIFIHNRLTGETTRVGEGFYASDPNGHSGSYDIGDSGNFVVFLSRAKNLILNNDYYDFPNEQIFVSDLNIPTTFDVDNDGYLVGTDCDDLKGQVNPGAPEIPYNSTDENCNGMNDDDDLDHDGYLRSNECNDENPNIFPGAQEIPNNGVDENCNGPADDTDRDLDGFIALTDCNDENPAIYPGAPEVKHDGIDQDCNYYDLTIDGEAFFKAGKGRLTVTATSNLGQYADLSVIGYGPMEYSGNRWSLSIYNLENKPSVISVQGPEGIETIPVSD